MALSRKDALLASVAAFIAWGFAVSWLPLLRYVGYAFVGGIALAVILALLVLFTTSRSREDTARNAIPPTSDLAFLSRSLWPHETETFQSERTYEPSYVYPQSRLISKAFDGILDLALKDFVSSWYGNISKSPTFVNEVDREIRLAIENIRDRLLREDLVNLGISRIVPIITTHLKEYDRAERVVRGRAGNRNITESEELDLAVATKFRDGKLHSAISPKFSDTKALQQEYLRKIIIRILPEVLPENLMKSRAVTVLVKEIVACAVLYPVMQMLSDPDTWNQLIEAYGRAALQDRKTVRKLRAALDEHASPKSAPHQAAAFPRLSPGDSERAFERFVKAIRRCNNLPDARQFRSQVASQLKRESSVEGQDQIYLRRLETGKRVLDQKVTKLLAKAGNQHPLSHPSDFRNGGINPAREASLVDVMHNAAGLSYFMEYMERQGKMYLVQFWIVVDGFRNPLEDDFGEETALSGTASWTKTDHNDIAQINEAYLSRPELNISEDSRRAVEYFLDAGRKATPIQYRQARTAILIAQSAVLEELQTRHFAQFKKTDLYYKYLMSDEASSSVASKPEAKDWQQSPELPPAPIARLRPPPLARTASQPAEKKSNLRRAAASSSDLQSSSSGKLFDDLDISRRSIDRSSIDTDRSAPLFEDDYDTDPLANSTYSLGKDSQNADNTSQQKVMENMEAALNTIITEDPKDDKSDDFREPLFGSPVSGTNKSGPLFDSPNSATDWRSIDASNGDRVRPNLASLGLVNPSSRIGVFTDDDLFPDEEKFIEDEYADPDVPDKEENFHDEIHEAAPGDLGLSEAIAALTVDIEKLVSQDSVVDALTRKAELTNNTAELRILGKSKASIQREMRRKELQRQQYIVQESDNSLFGRSSIGIKSIMVGKEEDGRQFALYLLEIQRKAGDQMPAASWAVARRYSEFYDLHVRLRARYSSVRNLEFPRRRMVMKLQKEFLHKRRVTLEAYLRQLLLLPEVCRSREFRSFLSQQAILPTADPTSPATTDPKDIVSRIYNSVTDGMDDFLGNIAVLDQLSAAGQSLISAATSQLNSGSDIAPLSPATMLSNDAAQVAEAEAELNAFEDLKLEPFVKPICDIFLETFDLNKGNNWLRGRAVVVVLHQLLGGTIERKVRDLFRSFTSEDSMLRYIDLVENTMWPGGVRREAKLRTSQEKAKSRREAQIVLATLVPELVGSVVGRANAIEAARKIASVMNNEVLDGELAYRIVDEVVGALFDDNKAITSRGR
ncbi:MAG: hypothetical protein Q9160_000194 [Pyrenula sp. 1 TL-2023]